MARHPDSFAHAWLGFLETRGLLVSEPVLHIHFPDGPEKVQSRTQRWLLSAWERFQVEPSDPDRRRAWINSVQCDLLSWPQDNWRGPNALPLSAEVVHLDTGEKLRPTGILSLDGVTALVALWLVAPGQGLDRVERLEGHWRATPQLKLEHWLRATASPFGLLTDGASFRLVHVPEGLPAAWLEWDASLWFDEKPTLDGFATLLGASRFFGPEKLRLAALVAESQEKQTELTDRLGEQVRGAVEQLILALDASDQAAGGRLLASVSPDEIYRAALYVVMRLVFLLFAEERSLLPHGTVLFDEGYGLGRLMHTLEEERRQLPETFAREADAWPRLLALFRLVFHGCPHPDLPLPAYGGDLFDPEGSAAMRLLEHPGLGIPNAAAYKILRALTFGEAKVGRETIPQRYSYRTLDVEHIGYLYEGLLDHKAARAGSEVLVKLRGAAETAYPLRELETRQGDDLVEWLADRGALGGNRERVGRLLAAPQPEPAHALARLDEGTQNRVAAYAPVIQTDKVVEPGRLYLTTSLSRRASGTHYTPIQYTRAMVEETLDPLVYAGEHGKLAEPRRLRSPRELLDLKLCDQAMGSGAFIVQLIRYLAEKLVDAWQVERECYGESAALFLPYAERGADSPERIPLPAEREEALVWARRLVAERCIYGVDKNPLAVEMAKLSVWLVTLSRDKPFSFLDHALKTGDSLLGISSLDQLRTFTLDGKGDENTLFAGLVAERIPAAVRLRSEVATTGSASPSGVVHQAELHKRAEDELRTLKALADLVIAPWVAAVKPAEQARLRASLFAEATHLLGEYGRLEALARRHLGEHRPFHWPLEFPEVFERDNPGFDAFTGNPAFMGGQKITGNLGVAYRDYLVGHVAGGARGSADLVTYFFLRAYRLLRDGGNFGLLAVNTIAEGDTRQVGLEPLLKANAVIYSAHPNEPWPNAAAVVTSRVHIHKGRWQGGYAILGLPAVTISAFLSDHEEWSPKRLKANGGIAFIGSYVLGMGFVLTPEEAQGMLDRDPRNADVLFPYLIGDDLNTHPHQEPPRWVINFWDWPEERAATYREPFERVCRLVKPERDRLGDDPTGLTRKHRWWLYGRDAKGLYHAIGRGQAFCKHPPGWSAQQAHATKPLGKALTGKHHAFWPLPDGAVYDQTIIVFAERSPELFLVLQSSVFHAWWLKQGGKLKQDPRFNIDDCFLSLPFPGHPIAEAATRPREFLEATRGVMQRLGQGMTKAFNLVHDPKCNDADVRLVRDLQRSIDLSTCLAFGWDGLDLGHGFHDVPQLPRCDRVRFTISEAARRQVLERLDALNRQRHQEEVDQGLHGKAAKRPAHTRRHDAPRAEPPTAPTPEPAAPGETPRAVTFQLRSDPQQLTLFGYDSPELPMPRAADAPGTQPRAASQPAPAPIPSHAEAILTWLRAHPGWHPRADICAATATPDAAWPAAIGSLLSANLITRTGTKRGTRYSAKE